jgi:UBA/TS-N domain
VFDFNIMVETTKDDGLSRSNKLHYSRVLTVPQEDDAEFDLIAAAGPVPDISPATVFYARSDHQGEKDPFVAVTHGSVSEFIDSRISTFTEMGFSSEEAVSALRSCHDDVNEALSMLLHQNDV